MFISVFKSNHRIVTLFILLLTALLAAPYLKIAETSAMFGHPLIDYLIVVALVSFQAIYFNGLVNREKLVENNTHLTSLMFVVINCAAFAVLHLSEIIIANTFVILSVGQLFKVYNEKFKKAEVFNASLLMGLAATIYPPYITGFLILFVLMFYLTTPVWRDVVVLLIGFIIPPLYLHVYHFYSGGIEAVKDGFFLGFDWNIGLVSVSFGAKLFLSAILLLSVLAVFSFVRTIAYSVVKVRKLLWSVVFIGLMGWLTLFLNGGNLMLLLLALVIPLSILLANFLERLKIRWLTEILFATLFVGFVWIYFS